MTRVYILIDNERHDIIGVFTSKEKLIQFFKGLFKDYIHKFNPKRVEKLEKLLSVPDEELINFLMDKRDDVPDYISSEIRWYDVEEYELDT